ncbi:neuroglobin-like [Ruditapes philippinarum]|uniref:neuroglobin-like n=1 Tax=Ruditapes philippinarum TaxID=129788 RepID=UPI00295AAC2A|nr:neuroglobin-like [Ruditapes philippinarum]
MGCTSSISYKKVSCKHYNSFLASQKSTSAVTANKIELLPRERVIVQRSWPALQKDLQGNGLQVFLKIFELCPEVKSLFSVENVRHSQLAKNAMIKAHGARFIKAIGVTINDNEEFEHDENKLCKYLFVLGHQHKRFARFKSEYFEIFYDALMWQWGRCLGENFTQEVSDAWSRVFVFLMVKLREGYCSNEEQLSKI